MTALAQMTHVNLYHDECHWFLRGQMLHRLLPGQFLSQYPIARVVYRRTVSHRDIRRKRSRRARNLKAGNILSTNIALTLNQETDIGRSSLLKTLICHPYLSRKGV